MKIPRRGVQVHQDVAEVGQTLHHHVHYLALALHLTACDTGRFVLREGNNMAPGTPIENIEAMYYARRKYGEVRTE